MESDASLLLSLLVTASLSRLVLRVALHALLVVNSSVRSGKKKSRRQRGRTAASLA